MAETLLIRLAADATGFRDWVLVNEQGRAESPVQTGVPDVGVINATSRVVVLVPGNEVLLRSARIPGRSRQRALRAIPFALEEQIACDVDLMHFALGPLQEDGHYPVAAVERSRMDDWAELLLEQGIQAQQMVPDILALPLSGEDWSLLVDAGSVMLRRDPFQGFVADLDTFPVLLELFGERNELPAHAQLYGPGLLDTGDLPVDLNAQQSSPLEILGSGWATTAHIDLLQGAYSRTEQWGRLLRPWRATAALLVAGVLLAGMSAGINYYHLSAQQEQLRADIEAEYRKAFPDARRVVDARAQMEQQLKQLQRRGGGDVAGFLVMLAQVGEVLRSTEGVNINGATYRDGRLDLDLQADSLQILDGLKQALVAEGRMQADIQSATSEEGQKVRSRIRIQGVGV